MLKIFISDVILQNLTKPPEPWVHLQVNSYGNHHTAAHSWCICIDKASRYRHRLQVQPTSWASIWSFYDFHRKKVGSCSVHMYTTIWFHLASSLRFSRGTAVEKNQKFNACTQRQRTLLTQGLMSSISAISFDE